ncbi:S8 family serine peptidase [Streptomyces luteolus]|uniref:S8 family serine peptidase n=1 Tax=Streptomyces luteolus TaxID=3043615 RepID=A0ABT6T4D8_9ACTN|nr:S8 family serine peptidase [Streptomyces sp. B-S-A12]MDI3422733.1 S8 family serine peptidase [Streptomyces sp. B-S-A12]
MTRAAPSRRRPRLLVAGLALALLPAGQASAAGAEAGTPPQQRTQAAAAARTVTLVTGDQVTVTDLGGGRKAVAVERPRGATGAVRTQTSKSGRISVVPDEAAPHLRAGRLDPRLFDVTGLMDQGLTGQAGLPLIVTYGKEARTAAVPKGTDKVRALPSVDGVAVQAERNAEFWRALTAGERGFTAGVRKVWLDGRVEAELAESNAQIGSPEAWQAGITGKGVKVAVLDTGVDDGHPDLVGRIAASESFIEGQEVADKDGHGTHVTSTVGGSGAGSDGKEKGVAPGAELAVGKVLSDEGSGTESQIIAGMEWAAKDVDAKIVSMSLGSREPSDGTDPMAQAVNTLTEETGALFVVAAGNSGAPGSIGSPGAADSALTVGAVDADDRAADFTSRGPRHGDQALKPDLSAPGVRILAARSQLAEGSGLYTSMSGTSMATPHIAGVAALLAEKHPDWTGQQLKDALMSSAKTLPDSPYDLGAGRVDVPAAIGAHITATGSADLGFHSWPYDANKPVTRTLTYANSSDEDVELKLSAQGAPDGVVSLADPTLTVPAHSTARTTVTGDGTKAAVGTTGGRIVAEAAGKQVAHTAFGLVKEEERYTLTVHVKDRDGAPAATWLNLLRLAEGAEPVQEFVGDSGTVRLRLKPGTYSLNTFLDVRGAHGEDSLGLGFLAEPEVKLDRNREVTLDGRELRQVDARVDRRTETRQLVMEYTHEAAGTGFGGVVQLPMTYDSVFAAPTGKVDAGTFEYRTVWRLGKPLLSVEAGGKRLREVTAQPGSTLPDGVSRLAVVDAGDGAPAAYEGKDVRGKAAVVRADGSVEPERLAQAAQDAGAKALFVTDGAPGRLMGWFGTAAGEDRALTVGTVDAADGARLRAAAHDGRRVTVDGTRNTPYVYDLSEGHPGGVPDEDLTYRPGKRELARIQSEFHAAKPAPGGEFRYSISENFPIGFGFPEKIDFPAERTDYVSTGPGQRWHESVTNGPGTIEQRSGTPTYEGGSRTELDWFKPVLHPWLGTGLGWGQQRNGNDLRFNVPGWGDSGPDHTGFGDVWDESSGLTQQTKVYVDGELVDEATSSGAYAWDVAPHEQEFRVVTDTTSDPDRWRLATKGHAEWTFRSSETPSDRYTFLPMLNLGFDVETDLRGDVRGGGRVPVGLFAEYVKGAEDTGRIVRGSLEVSYDDGVSWSRVDLREGSGASWKGVLRVPRDAQFISLRASAEDDRGGAVKQEIVRGVGVK